MPENHLVDVVAARAQFASSPAGPERAWRIVNAVALRLGGDYGLYAKSGGTNFRGYSIDILIRRESGETYDILGDAEGEARPQWGPTQPSGHGDVANWRPPITDQPIPPEPPPTPTQTPPYDDTMLRTRIQALEMELAHLRPLVETLADRMDHLRVKGSTARTWSHAHDVDLKVQG